MSFHERCPVFDTLAEQRAYERGYLDASTQYLKILADIAALQAPTIQVIGPLPEGFDLNWRDHFAKQARRNTEDQCADTKPPSN